jgi:hypothetical protein
MGSKREGDEIVHYEHEFRDESWPEVEYFGCHIVIVPGLLIFFLSAIPETGIHWLIKSLTASLFPEASWMYWWVGLFIAISAYVLLLSIYNGMVKEQEKPRLKEVRRESIEKFERDNLK